MKKVFVTPQVEIVEFCEKDIIMLSTNEKGSAMELDLEDLFIG